MLFERGRALLLSLKTSSAARCVLLGTRDTGRDCGTGVGARVPGADDCARRERLGGEGRLIVGRSMGVPERLDPGREGGLDAFWKLGPAGAALDVVTMLGRSMFPELSVWIMGLGPRPGNVRYIFESKASLSCDGTLAIRGMETEGSLKAFSFVEASRSEA